MSTHQTDSFQPSGPQAYATPSQGVQPPAPVGPPPNRKGRNVVGIAAFVVAVLGFIFAVWEGAYLLGWVLLPIAFVLSLVALFQSGKGKKLAVTGLILSIVGTIAGVVAFTASAARVVDDAFSDGPVTAAPPAGETTLGTRANPHPLGTAISSDDWTVTVNSFDADATDAVLAENPYNDKPEAGQAYALANVTLTYVGAEVGTPMEVSVSYVTGAGNTVQSYDALVLAPDAISSNELYNGASATGNIVVMIPEGDEGTLRVRLGVLAEEVFVAIS